MLRVPGLSFIDHPTSNNPTLAEDARVGLPAKGGRTWQVGAYPHFRRRFAGKQGLAVVRKMLLLPSFFSIVSGRAKTFHVAIVNFCLMRIG